MFDIESKGKEDAEISPNNEYNGGKAVRAIQKVLTLHPLHTTYIHAKDEIDENRVESSSEFPLPPTDIGVPSQPWTTALKNYCIWQLGASKAPSLVCLSYRSITADSADLLPRA